MTQLFSERSLSNPQEIKLSSVQILQPFRVLFFNFEHILLLTHAKYVFASFRRKVTRLGFSVEKIFEKFRLHA